MTITPILHRQHGQILKLGDEVLIEISDLKLREQKNYSPKLLSLLNLMLAGLSQVSTD